MNFNKRLAAGIALGLAATLAAPVSQAADDTNKIYFGPQVTYLWTDKERNVDDDAQFGLFVGKRWEKWAVEAALNRGDFAGPTAPGDTRLTDYGVNVLRHFYPESKIKPFLLAGIGTQKSSRSADNTNTRMFQAGLGALINLHEASDGSSNVSLRPQLVGRWSKAPQGLGGGNLFDLAAGLGIQIAFGAARPAPPPPAPEPAPAPVAAPAPQPPPPPPPPPPPADDDKDGVINENDACPNSPPGAKVDERGCEIGEVVLRGVVFETDSAVLTPESLVILDGVVATLDARPGAKAELRGHTDSRGSDKYNQALSERRAAAVVKYLVERGIAKDRLTSAGYGESRPIDSNDTDAGRQANRRVSIEFARP